ncbi:hypothetical protein ABZY90_28725 [Streptomyces sp. NPDC006422]|uniref:hypothetical protein n=1 Tax=unclassified Streptomyces TaxID=2593676 RepID=UPI0033A5EF59
MEHAVGPYRGTLYRFALAVSAVTAVLAFAILSGGFAATWGAFEDIRRYADRNIANEDSYYAYADGGTESLVGPGFVVFALALVLALLCVSVLHSGYAVGAAHLRRGGDPLSVGELWRRSRARLASSVVTNLLTALVVAAVVFAGLVLFDLAQRERIPGVERTDLHETATPQYAVVGFVVPIVIWCLGPLLWFRLSGATAETVLEGRSPFVAVYRSWVLTRRARARAFGLGLVCCAAAVAVFVAGRWLFQPFNHYAGLGMLWLSGDNVWITGMLMKVLPTVVALLLVPPLVMPLVSGEVARLHGELRADEETAAGSARSADAAPPSSGP